jgi:hypothetical protein
MCLLFYCISIHWSEQSRSGWAWKFASGSELGCLHVEGAGTFIAEPLMAVAGVVPGSFFVLLDEPGVVHGTKLTDEDGFGFLIELGSECHGSETMSMGLRTDTFS